MRDTIEMAREAGFHVMTDPLFGDAWLAQHHESNFYKFEALVRADERNRTWTQEHWTEYEQAIVAAERDACAKTRAGKPRQLPRLGMGMLHGEQQHCFEMGWKEGAAAVRAAIRARGNT